MLTSPLQFFIYCSMSEQFRLTVRQLFSSRLLFVAQAQATFHGGKRYSLILIDVELIQQQQQKYNKQQQQQHYGSQQHRVSQLFSYSSPSYINNNNNTSNNDTYSHLPLHKQQQQQLLQQSNVEDCTAQVEVYRTGNFYCGRFGVNSPPSAGHTTAQPITIRQKHLVELFKILIK